MTRLSGLIIASVLTIGLAGSVIAQDPTATVEGVVTHPAHIHVGSCAALDPNPAYPLNDVGPRLKDDQLPLAEDMMGSLAAAPVEISEKDGIEVTFDDLFTEAYAITIHESAQNIQNYIACGDIGGPVIDDRVLIGLGEQNDSGYAGIAIIEKDGDDHVKVSILLTRGLWEAPVEPEVTPTV